MKLDVEKARRCRDHIEKAHQEWVENTSEAYRNVREAALQIPKMPELIEALNKFAERRWPGYGDCGGYQYGTRVFFRMREIAVPVNGGYYNIFLGILRIPMSDFLEGVKNGFHGFDFGKYIADETWSEFCNEYYHDWAPLQLSLI